MILKVGMEMGKDRVIREWGEEVLRGGRVGKYEILAELRPMSQMARHWDSVTQNKLLWPTLPKVSFIFPPPTCSHHS